MNETSSSNTPAPNRPGQSESSSSAYRAVIFMDLPSVVVRKIGANERLRRIVEKAWVIVQCHTFVCVDDLATDFGLDFFCMDDRDALEEFCVVHLSLVGESSSSTASAISVICPAPTFFWRSRRQSQSFQQNNSPLPWKYRSVKSQQCSWASMPYTRITLYDGEGWMVRIS